MIKDTSGFSIIELMVAMIVFLFAIAATSQVFVPMLTQFKQQSTISETQMESIVGLEVLRRDVESAGYGLPWVIPPDVTTGTYAEAAAATTAPIPAPSTYNDAPNPPRAVLSGDNAGLIGTDYLVVKAMSVALNDTSVKWTHVIGQGGGVSEVGKRPSPQDDLVANDRTIVMIPSRGGANERILVSNGVGVYTVQFSDPFDNTYSPATEGDKYLVYGVADDTAATLRMPFNRADYYIRDLARAAVMPKRCAANTGLLMKSVINHADGTRTGSSFPLLDCVADFQVTYFLDTDEDGDVDWPPSDDISGMTAEDIRNQVMEIRVYIVSHEGRKDATNDFSLGGARTNLSTAEVFGSNSRTLNFADLKVLVGDPDYKYYRWKLYTLVVRTKNMR